MGSGGSRRGTVGTAITPRSTAQHPAQRRSGVSAHLWWRGGVRGGRGARCRPESRSWPVGAEGQSGCEARVRPGRRLGGRPAAVAAASAQSQLPCPAPRKQQPHPPAPAHPQGRAVTPPSCAFQLCCGEISRSAPLAAVREGSHTATVPSAAAVSRRSGPPGASAASGSIAVTALPCAPLRRGGVQDGERVERRSSPVARSASNAGCRLQLLHGRANTSSSSSARAPLLPNRPT